MPELPEVETVRRVLTKAKFVGPVQQVWRSRKALRTGAHWRRSQERLEQLLGAVPLKFDRRGKHLVWHFERGENQVALLVHLGMSGRCEIAQADTARAPHTHLVLSFRDQREFRFVDPRRFGGLRAGTLEQIYQAPPISQLGPEPLARNFDGRNLEAALGASRRPIRDALLDQRAVAGIGNIYAVEALYLSGIHPGLACTRLRSSAWERLAQALVKVLRAGIRAGGTTLKDYRQPDGRRGDHVDRLRVYGRAGEPCAACGTRLQPFVSGGRSAVFCPHEQPKPRGRLA